MDVLNKFLSKDGRFSRKAYVLGFVLPGAALLAGTYAAFTFAPEAPLRPGLAGAPRWAGSPISRRWMPRTSAAITTLEIRASSTA